MPGQFVPLPNGAQVEMRFTESGQQVENVYHVLGGAPFVASELSQIGEAFYLWWSESIKPLAVSALTLNSIVVRGMDSINAPAVEETSNMPVSGDITQVAMPMNVTVAVKWITNKAGRSFRGRTFHLGLAVNDVTDSRLSNGIRLALSIAYNQLVTDMAGNSWQLVVVSKVTQGFPRMVAEATPIVAAGVDNTSDSQRRRLPGRGA